ncbi:MAG: hypothetical protein ACRC46_04520 [Thermoguttaceae bacterium]
MKLRVYVDTSVVGGKFEDRFAVASNRFWDAVMDGELRILVSPLLEEEVNDAPQPVRSFFRSIPESVIERIPMLVEIDDLADRYITEQVVGKSSRSDCLHIAFASVYRADVVVSWNFRHIVNINRIRGYHSVNIKLGYPLVEIRTPNEVVNYENDDR